MDKIKKTSPPAGTAADVCLELRETSRSLQSRLFFIRLVVVEFSRSFDFGGRPRFVDDIDEHGG